MWTNRYMTACSVGKGRGTLQTDGTYVYTWDFLNRLVRVDDTTGHLVVGYGYDAFNRRVVKIFPDNTPSPTGAQPNGETWYTFAGQHVVQESQRYGSVVPTTVPPTAAGIHVIRQWVYGPSVDEVLAMDVDANMNGNSAIDAADARYYYVYDSGGNVLGLVNQAGHLVEGYAYQPFGSPTILVPASGSSDVKFDGTDTISTGPYAYGTSTITRPYSPSGNLWFFNGRQYDPEIGLYNYRARHYHPGLGQFMSMDPIGVWGDPGNLGNPYAYVGNNPGSMRDPSGTCGTWWNGYVGGCLWDIGIGIGNAGVALGQGYLDCEAGGVSACMDAAGSSIENGWNSLSSSVSATSDCFVDGGSRCDDMCANPNLVSGLACHYDQCGQTSGTGAQLDCYISANVDFALVDASIALPAAALPGAVERGALALRGSASAFAASEAAETALLPRLGTAAKASSEFPTNPGGFSGRPLPMWLDEGQVISRYGGESGRYASPAGTPAAMRSLRPGTDLADHHLYQVARPFTASSGTAQPWYGQPGGGIQYRLPSSVEELVQSGHLRRLP